VDLGSWLLCLLGLLLCELWCSLKGVQREGERFSCAGLFEKGMESG
jgi:hypothetical protein